MFRFEKLEVWQEAIAFADDVYRMTRPFPREEQYGLTSQMRRAAVSVSSNIAEGSGRSSDTEFSRFLEIAYGSLMESVSQAHIAVRQEYLPESDRDDLRARAERIARMLSGLRSSLKA